MGIENQFLNTYLRHCPHFERFVAESLSVPSNEKFEKEEESPKKIIEKKIIDKKVSQTYFFCYPFFFILLPFFAFGGKRPWQRTWQRSTSTLSLPIPSSTKRHARTRADDKLVTRLSVSVADVDEKNG